jgi:hypothetical protein
VLIADACHDAGFELPALPVEVIDAVRKRVRADVISMGNPLVQ